MDYDKLHYRRDGNGIVRYVPESDEGDVATLQQRTAIGKFKDGSIYLRASDAEDVSKIKGVADALGLSYTQRRGGASHFGRTGSYEHLHFGHPQDALNVHAALGYHLEENGQPSDHEAHLQKLAGGMHGHVQGKDPRADACILNSQHAHQMSLDADKADTPDTHRGAAHFHRLSAEAHRAQASLPWPNGQGAHHAGMAILHEVIAKHHDEKAVASHKRIQAEMRRQAEMKRRMEEMEEGKEVKKALVHTYTKTVNGRLVQVHEHSDSRNDASDKLSDADLSKMFDLSHPKIWKDKAGTEECKCFRCKKPIKTVATLNHSEGGQQHFGLDCLLTLKGKKSGKKITPATQRQEIQDYLEQGFADSMKDAKVEVNLTSKKVMGQEVYEATVDGVDAGSSSSRYGIVNAVAFALNKFRDQSWDKVKQEYTDLTGAKSMGGNGKLKAPVPTVTGFTVDGVAFDPAQTLYKDVKKASDTYSMPLDEAIQEHERLVKVLESPDHQDDLEEVKDQGEELAEMKETKKSLGTVGAGTDLSTLEGGGALRAEGRDDELADATMVSKAVEPTPAQIDAGNYTKTHIRVQGLAISIENPKGSIRRGTDKDGHKWESKMAADYGYFTGVGEAKDGDAPDVFVGPDPENPFVHIVNQVDPKTGAYDEMKVMLGYKSREDAIEGYLANYEKGWKGLGDVKSMHIDDFKEWLKHGDIKHRLIYKAATTRLHATSRIQMQYLRVHPGARMSCGFSDAVHAAKSAGLTDTEILRTVSNATGAFAPLVRHLKENQ